MRILTASAILAIAACAPPQADSFRDVPELTPQDTLSCEETTLDFFDVNSDRIHPSKVRYGASTEDGTLDPTDSWARRIDGQLTLELHDCNEDDLDCGPRMTLVGSLFGFAVDGHGVFLDDWQWCAIGDDGPLTFIGHLATPRPESLRIRLSSPDDVAITLTGEVTAVPGRCDLLERCDEEFVGDLELTRLPFAP
jgi:hypothetical protein